MMQQIRGKSPINKDLKPLSYLIQIKSHWQIFSDNYWIMIVFFILILFFIFRKFNAARFGMFAAGFSSITAELTIIYLFQMVFGNAYQFAGIVFTIFMTGLVIGPLIPIRSIIPTKIAIVASLFAMGILAMAIPFILKTILDTQTIKLLVYLAFFFSTLIVAINTAYLFKLSALLIQNQGGNIAGEIYSADLYGSAIGALIISILIIPYLGIIFSGLPGGILCMIAAIFLFKSK
jgi:spermidine synthase